MPRGAHGIAAGALACTLACAVVGGSEESSRAQKEAPTSALVGRWQLSSFRSAPGEQSVLPDTKLDAEFTGDGEVRGSAGCNRYFGSYQIKAPGRLSIGPLASTRKACPEPIMRQEGRFLGGLSGATIFRAAPDRLELGYDEVGGVLIFTRTSAPEAG